MKGKKKKGEEKHRVLYLEKKSGCEDPWEPPGEGRRKKKGRGYSLLSVINPSGGGGKEASSL